MSNFRTICADPPWNEQGSGKIKRGAQRHYPLMSKSKILSVMLQSGVWRPATHAHLYLWVTNRFLPDGLWLMGELGFRYITNIAWAKNRYGLGQYFRGQHELMLFGVRGKGQHPSVMTKRRDLSSCLLSDHVRDEGNRRVHSAKPVVFRRLIEARSKGPRLEMFARGAPEPGWTQWGDQLVT